jgi:16S rRNA (uracil1498-N3)-methyltransferase
MGAGDRFRALLPTGEEITVAVLSVGPTALVGSVASIPVVAERGPVQGDGSADEIEAERSSDLKRRAALPSLPPVVLLQALPKGQKMDLIVRQATEAGVSLILPFVADHSISRVAAGSDAESKRERWERIAREARQQSGSDVPTRIAAPASLTAAVDSWRSFAQERGGGAALLLHQDPLAQGTLHGYLSDDPPAVALAVGPEGGFSAAEAEWFIAAGFAPVIIGANVLRTETAALFAIAAVQTVLLEKASWMLKTPDSPASKE